MFRTKDPRELLDLALEELGLEASELQRRQWIELAELLERWGQRINLTGHRSVHAVVARLVLDALAIARWLPAQAASLVDLGSGAGFPGLPIAIARPELEVRLVESRERRHHFQRAVIRTLGLENVRPIRGRIEDLVPEPAEIAIAQAVSPPSELLALMLPWTLPGGFMIIPGSEQPPDPGQDPRVKSAEIHRYLVPGGGPRRTLWIGCRR
jgi:16S rRNA (guanine527-N7)-methyltransferase